MLKKDLIAVLELSPSYHMEINSCFSIAEGNSNSAQDRHFRNGGENWKRKNKRKSHK